MACSGSHMKGYSPVGGGSRGRAHIKAEAGERADPTRAIRRLGTLAGSLAARLCPSLEQPEHGISHQTINDAQTPM